jgi:hypothetical protein
MGNCYFLTVQLLFRIIRFPAERKSEPAISSSVTSRHEAHTGTLLDHLPDLFVSPHHNTMTSPIPIQHHSAPNKLWLHTCRHRTSINHNTRHPSPRQSRQDYLSRCPLRHIITQSVPTTLQLPTSLIFPQTGHESPLNCFQIPKLRSQLPRRTRRTGHTKPQNIFCKSRSRPRTPPMRMRDVARIIIIPSRRAIPKTPICTISFDYCAFCAIRIIKIPTPRSPNKLKGTCCLPNTKVSLNLKT